MVKPQLCYMRSRSYFLFTKQFCPVLRYVAEYHTLYTLPLRNPCAKVEIGHEVRADIRFCLGLRADLIGSNNTTD